MLNYDWKKQELLCQFVNCKECRKDVEVIGELREVSNYFVCKFGNKEINHHGVKY